MPQPRTAFYLSDDREQQLRVFVHHNTVDPSIWTLAVGPISLIAIDPSSDPDSPLARGTVRILDEIIEGLFQIRTGIKTAAEAAEASSPADGLEGGR